MKISTTIPTEAKAFIESLPKRATFNGISMNESHDIVILWEDDTLYSGLTVPVEWPLNMVKSNKLPPKVIKACDRQKAPVPQPKQQNAVESQPAPKPVLPVYLDEEGLREAVAKGTPVEYQGLQPRWLPFNPKLDKFIEGFYYRTRPVVDKKAVIA